MSINVLVGWEDLLLLRVISASFPAVAASAATLSCFDKLKSKQLSSFTEVISDQLGTQPMKVPPMIIFLKDNAIPHHISVPSSLPQHFEEAAQAKIDKHLASDVLIKCDEPTYWCAPGFFAPKENGNIVRLVTDYTKLNKYVYTPFTHFLPYRRLFKPSLPCQHALQN